ncbi:MAG: GTP-binding protein [Promethearchaeota archaeon]
MKHIKIAILGDMGVGKTTIRSFYTGENIFEALIDDSVVDAIEIIGTDSEIKYATIDGQDILLQFVDIGGQLRFFELNRASLVGSQGALIVYDVNNANSFLNIPKWVKRLSVSSGMGLVPFLVLGNKIDLLNGQSSLITEIYLNKLMRRLEDIGKRHGFRPAYVETSALDGTNIDRALTEIIKMIIEVNFDYETLKKFKVDEKTILPQEGEEDEGPEEIAPLFGATVHTILTSEERQPTLEERSSAILITRDWQFIDEQYIFTIYFRNHTHWPINEVVVQLFEYPESLQPLRKEMLAERIPPDGLGTFSFRFDVPKTPIVGKIRAKALYVDHNGHSNILIVHPYDVLVLSDLLKHLDKTNEEIALLLNDLKAKFSMTLDAWGKTGVMFLEHISSFLQNRDFRIIRKIGRETDKGFVGRLLTGGIGKIKPADVLLFSIDVIEQSKENSSVRLEAVSSDNNLSESFIIELKDLILKEEIIPYFKEMTVEKNIS